MENIKHEIKGDFNFCYTQDGSVGLYNSEVQDVYHSVFGAKSEGWEKFVMPLNFEKNFAHKNELKVLDICFGIGYNTKALLKKLLLSSYKGSVEIDALEYDKKLVLLSPFIKDGYFNNYPEISFVLFSNFFSELLKEKQLLQSLMTNKTAIKFIEPFYRRFIGCLNFNRCVYTPRELKQAFVHNIYYHCISQRNKRCLRPLRIGNFKIIPHFKDARVTLKSLNDYYDIIFLDAFTPTKLPTLWSYEFFKELYRLSCDETILVTYSNSSAVRHAMTDAGFYVGKLFDKNKRPCGTIAATNPNLIEFPLDEYDKGLMQTNAGIYFRDENLNLSAEEILAEYNQRKSQLGLESSSHYIKRFKEMNRSNK